jgi:predicted anti-sigma-YlaC factor YlaD
MNVTKNVVIDLLPAYLSGEASADTRALIEEMAAREPAVARLLDAARRDEREPALRQAIVPPADLERESVSRTRAALRWRGWLLALSIACALTPFAMAFDGGHVMFVMFYDKPASQVLWLLALAFWLGYSALGRRLREF